MDDSLQMPIVASELKNRRAPRDILNREVPNRICTSAAGECEEALARQNLLCARRGPDL